MELIEETIKPAINFIKEVKNKKVAIIHGHDNDSICSAAIMYKLLKNTKADPKLFVSDLNFAIAPNVIDPVKRFKPDFVIAVDLAEVTLNILTGLRNISKVMIIDHHKPKGYVRVTYVNPRVYDNSVYIPATYLCYRIYEKLSNTDEILWIAGIGTLSDMGLKYCNDLFNAIKSKSNELVGKNNNDDETLFDNSVLGKLAKIFDSARVVNGVGGSVAALNSLINSKSYNDVLSGIGGNKKLLESYAIVDKEFTRLITDFQKKKKESPIIYEVKSKYNMKSSLSGYLSKTLHREILVLYQKSGKYIEVSFRRGNMSLADLNELAGKSVEKIPDSSGGGHPVASGARFPVAYLTKFLANLKNYKTG